MRKGTDIVTLARGKVIGDIGDQYRHGSEMARRVLNMPIEQLLRLYESTVSKYNDEGVVINEPSTDLVKLLSGMNVEAGLAVRMAMGAFFEGDLHKYKELMARVYGKPGQEIQLVIEKDRDTAEEELADLSVDELLRVDELERELARIKGRG